MNIRIFTFALLLFVILFMGVSSHAQDGSTEDRTPVIIDTDMSVDDWWAILYLSQHPDVETLAVSVTGTAVAHCEPGVQNARDLLALVGSPETPVACGSESPTQGDHAFPDEIRDYVETLMVGLALDPNPTTPIDGTAVELLINTIQESPEKVTLITLGPLTNVAEALEADPTIIENLEMIYVTGGAVDVAGGVEGWLAPGNTVAEANIYIDPHAAGVVFASGAPITLVPMDATNHVPITVEFYERLEGDHGTPAADFVYRSIKPQLDFIFAGGYYFFDPLAVAIATDETLATIEERNLTVIEEEGANSGQTLEAESGSPIRVAVEADREQFETVFLDILNGR
jgi:inosine-uridine nucleoside N-ribohydrolase